MDIIFNCQNCEQELEVDASGAGSEISCPSCSETITIPEPGTKGTRTVDGDSDSPAGQASDGLRKAVGALLDRAKQAAAVRPDAELPEVYALLVAASRATVRDRLDEAAITRLLTIISDGLAPHAAANPTAAGK